ncbi:MAG: hypothetical protein NXI12_08190 [Alphaproteobacteria bacterium]|nr:hypothetical protein [Alphaproteobacteria bacterium]
MLRKLLTGSACLSAVLGASAAAQTPHPIQAPTDLPDAQIGQCYQFVRLDAEYETVMQTIVVADEYEIFDVTDPRLERRQRSYVSREAGMRYRVTEPVYETVTEQVQVRPGYVRYEVTPAQTRTVAERVLVREARMVWRRGYVDGARQVRHDPETGEIWCLVEEPAQYETVHRTLVTQNAQLREVPVEPQYETISRDVLVRPATVEEVPIPAQHASYDIQVLTEEGGVHRRTSQRRTQQVARHELVSGERFEWRLVDCADIDIPDHPGARPPAPSVHGAAPQSGMRIRHVPQGDDPHGDADYDERDSTPVASLNTRTLHPGAPSRRSSGRR